MKNFSLGFILSSCVRFSLLYHVVNEGLSKALIFMFLFCGNLQGFWFRSEFDYPKQFVIFVLRVFLPVRIYWNLRFSGAAMKIKGCRGIFSFFIFTVIFLIVSLVAVLEGYAVRITFNVCIYKWNLAARKVSWGRIEDCLIFHLFFSVFWSYFSRGWIEDGLILSFLL